jgi:hypothetical protein
MVRATVYQPQVQVLLVKNVDRTTAGDGVPLSARYQGADRVIDLSPWLSDASGVRTSKSVRDPAGGFSLTLSDRIHDKDLDSLYGLIEPMDCIEIRMARRGEVKVANGGKLPIVMRGFISDVRRAEGVTGAGKPQRQIVVTGQDYGKLWQIFQIFYEKNFPVGATLISNWKLFLKFGMGFKNQSCRAFVKEAVQKILNEFIKNMKGKNESGKSDEGSPLQEIKIDDKDITAAPGTVAPTGVNQFQGGTLYSMLNSFGDVGPWNELFIEDREAGVFLVYRPNPFYAVNGDYLPVKRFDNKDAKEPARVAVQASDIVSIAVARTDGNVANYFWVDAPRSQMTNGSTAKLMAVQGAPDTFLIDHRNATQSIYGLRKMFDVTNQGDPLEETHGNGADKETHAKQYNLTAGWINKRRIEIVEQNKDNVVFESGSLRIIGREDIRAGMYIDVVRGSMEYGFYVVQVDQEFIPFQGFFTTLTVERGTGFIKRAQREGALQSPYYAELSSRV